MDFHLVQSGMRQFREKLHSAWTRCSEWMVNFRIQGEGGTLSLMDSFKDKGQYLLCLILGELVLRVMVLMTRERELAGEI